MIGGGGAAFISRQTHAILTRLLPDATTLHLEGCEVDEAAVQITLRTLDFGHRALSAVRHPSAAHP